MFRGTTPTLYFKINNIEDMSTIKEVHIIFKTDIHHYCLRDDGSKLIKTIDDVTIDAENKIITLDLSQLDTLALKPPIALVQIKFLFEDDKVCASTICEIPIEQPLDDRVMIVRNNPPEEEDPSTDDEENTEGSGDEESTEGDGSGTAESEEDTTPAESEESTDETPDSEEELGG